MGTLTTLPDFLTRNATGELRFVGHRIGLYHFVHYYNDGYSAEMLAGQFPDLSLSLIHKAIAFYLDNKTAVDEYVAGCRDELQRQKAESARHLPLASLRERLARAQPAEGP